MLIVRYVCTTTTRYEEVIVTKLIILQISVYRDVSTWLQHFTMRHSASESVSTLSMCCICKKQWTDAICQYNTLASELIEYWILNQLMSACWQSTQNKHTTPALKINAQNYKINTRNQCHKRPHISQHYSICTSNRRKENAKRTKGNQNWTKGNWNWTCTQTFLFFISCCPFWSANVISAHRIVYINCPKRKNGIFPIPTISEMDSIRNVIVLVLIALLAVFLQQAAAAPYTAPYPNRYNYYYDPSLLQYLLTFLVGHEYI